MKKMVMSVIGEKIGWLYLILVLLVAQPGQGYAQQIMSASLVEHRWQGDSLQYVRLGTDEPLSGVIKFVRDEDNYELAHFSNGKLEGEYKRFRYDKCVVEGIYHDSRKDEVWRYYMVPFGPDNPAYIERQESYDDGLPHGEWIRYKTSMVTELKPVPVEKVYFERGEVSLRETFDEEGWQASSTTYRNNVKHGKSLEYYPDGTLRVEVEYNMGQPTGVYTAYHPNGQPAKRGAYDDVGKETGAWEMWADDGTLTGRAHYQKGVLAGPFEFYHDNGNLSEKGTYADDGSGRYIGRYQSYFEDGQPKEDYHTDENGRKQGTATRWYANGNVEEGMTYRDGVVTGEHKRFFEDGQPEELTTYSDSEHVVDDWGEQEDYAKSGVYKRWNGSGQLREEGQYEHDKKTGEWRTYTDGLLRSVQQFEDGLESGPYVLYHEGRLREEGQFKIITDDYGNRRSVKDGLWTEYYYESDYPEGLKRWEVQWKDGEKHGISRRYDTEGQVSLTETYEYGRLKQK